MRKTIDRSQEEFMTLRRSIRNVEEKLSFTNEPLLVDALSYELLGLRARMNYLFANAKDQASLQKEKNTDILHKNSQKRL